MSFRGAPFTRISPWSGVMKPSSRETSVDLPAPLPPTRAMQRPGASSRLTPFSAGRRPAS